MGRMTVGEVADAVGVSAKAIRLWEAKGLLPDIERTPGGYRLYDESHLAILRFIHQARTLGMTLADIRRVLDLEHAGAARCDYVARMLDNRIAEIDRTLSTLGQLRKTLLDVRDRADEAADTTGRGYGLCPIIEGSGDPYA
jgi:MerR family copper efflux transcriptional regulator